MPGSGNLARKLRNAKLARIRRLENMTAECAIQHLDDVRDFLKEDINQCTRADQMHLQSIAHEIDSIVDEHLNHAHDEELE